MWSTSLLKNKLPFIKNETGTTEKYTEVVYGIIGNRAFCLALYLTGVFEVSYSTLVPSVSKKSSVDQTELGK